MDTENPATWKKQVLLGVLAFVATPILITGMFRVLPDAIPGWAPPATLAGAAIILWFTARVPRSVPIGMLAGCVGWTLFLYWLFARWDSMSGG